MKKSFLPGGIMLGLLILGAQAGSASTLNFNQLPAAVQQTAQTELRNGPVTQVQSLQENGQTLYQITFQRPNGASKVIYLDANGTYVHTQGQSPTATPNAGPQLSLNQVPPAVQRTIITETKNGPVAKIEQMASQNGNLMYQVTFNTSRGRQKVIYLNPDGTYVQNGLAMGTANWTQTGAASSRQPLMGATTISLSQVPRPVQQVFQTEAGSSPVQTISRGTLNGQTVYEAAFNRGGQMVKLRVNTNGTVLPDDQDNRIVTYGPLLNPRSLSLTQAPAAVQNVIRSQAGNSPVQSIQEGQVNGQPVYEAAFNRNGQLMRMRVNATGSIMSFSRAQGTTGAVQQ
jgi:uncharacterized membrane protein YkoI